MNVPPSMAGRAYLFVQIVEACSCVPFSVGRRERGGERVEEEREVKKDKSNNKKRSVKGRTVWKNGKKEKENRGRGAGENSGSDKRESGKVGKGSTKANKERVGSINVIGNTEERRKKSWLPLFFFLN